MYWKDNKSDFSIVVFRNDDMAGYLSHVMRGKTVSGRPVSVSAVTSVVQCLGANMVYVPQEYKSQIPELKQKLKGTVVICSSDTKDSEAHISFFMLDGKLKFTINQEEIEKNNVSVNSSLATMASN